MYPTVTVPSSPNGLPMAMASWPTLQILVHGQFGGPDIHVAGLEPDNGDVGGGVGADDLALESGAVREPHGHLLGVLHDVGRSEDEPALVVDHTRAEPKGRLELHDRRIEQLGHLGSRLIRWRERVRHLVRRRSVVRGGRLVGPCDQQTVVQGQSGEDATYE